MSKSEYFEIGKIVNTQGIKGDVRVMPTTDDIDRFKKLKNIILVSPKNDKKTLDIEKVWFHKQFVIIKFVGIDDMNKGETLKNHKIIINRSEAIELKEDEYFISDLYDMEVYEEERFLGIITNIIFTGANDVYVVTNKEENKEILIPAIKKCILNINVKENKMNVKLLKGLE